MTTDLEKQFFDTFGIEPKYEDACTVEDKYWDNEELANEFGTFDQYMNCKCGNQENCTTECSCAYQKEIYPQITDSILLSLVKIACKESIISLTKMKNNTKEWAIYFGLDKNCIFYEKSFKDVILRGFIEYSNDIDIYQQVQALFKEE